MPQDIPLIGVITTDLILFAVTQSLPLIGAHYMQRHDREVTPERENTNGGSDSGADPDQEDHPKTGPNGDSGRRDG